MKRSLHLGPRDELSCAHWPFEPYEEEDESGEPQVVLWIKTGLQQLTNCFFSPTRYDDDNLAPRWHHPRMLVRSDGPLPGCRGIAVYDAFITAARTLDVNPDRPGWPNHGHEIGLVSFVCVDRTV